MQDIMINLINHPTGDRCQLTPKEAHNEHPAVIRPPMVHVLPGLGILSALGGRCSRSTNVLSTGLRGKTCMNLHLPMDLHFRKRVPSRCTDFFDGVFRWFYLMVQQLMEEWMPWTSA